MSHTIAEKNTGNRNGGAFFNDIRTIVDAARGYAYSAVNTAMVQAYWLIGKRIVEEEQHGKKRAEYGSFLIRELSKRLVDEFGKGFSVANLKNFRQFYLTFPASEKGYTVCSLSVNTEDTDMIPSIAGNKLPDDQKLYAVCDQLPVPQKSYAVRSLFEDAKEIPFLGRG